MKTIKWTKSKQTILNKPAIELMTTPIKDRELQICGKRGSIYQHSESEYRLLIQCTSWKTVLQRNGLLSLKNDSRLIQEFTCEAIIKFDPKDLDLVLSVIQVPVHSGRQVSLANLRDGA